VWDVQRLFSHFPSALPGLGLLALRVVLSGFLLFDANRLRAVAVSWPASDGTVGAAAALLLATCGAFAGVGVLMPITGLVIVALEAAILSAVWWAPDAVLPIVGSWQTRLCQAAIALSLALIGPGAYSLDARLFGRREISFPPRSGVHRS
jgi:putative oxidoreductase